jgi:hypothetical protein
MTDLGDPGSYLTLTDGTPVLTSDGERIGVVEHVLAAPDADVFDGLVVDTQAGPGGWRFVDAPLVESIHERGVVLSVDAAAAAKLPEPSENPSALSATPDDAGPDDLGDKLRRAWDWISGKY